MGLGLPPLLDSPLGNGLPHERQNLDAAELPANLQDVHTGPVEAGEEAVEAAEGVEAGEADLAASACFCCS